MDSGFRRDDENIEKGRAGLCRRAPFGSSNGLASGGRLGGLRLLLDLGAGRRVADPGVDMGLELGEIVDERA
jgi:hypothetical protein